MACDFSGIIYTIFILCSVFAASKRNPFLRLKRIFTKYFQNTDFHFGSGCKIDTEKRFKTTKTYVFEVFTEHFFLSAFVISRNLNTNLSILNIMNEMHSRANLHFHWIPYKYYGKNSRATHCLSNNQNIRMYSIPVSWKVFKNSHFPPKMVFVIFFLFIATTLLLDLKYLTTNTDWHNNYLLFFFYFSKH